MKGFLSLALLALTSVAAAEVRPIAGDRDARIQSVAYDADDVVALHVANGFVLTLELSPDERIETISLGNSGTWQAVPNRRGDRVFIKPMQGATLTNMTVITDSRRYNFSLEPSYDAEPNLPYAVRFTYPPPIVDIAPVVVEKSGYVVKGENALRPLMITDDGRSTSFRWSTDVAIPAIYMVNARGREALVNGTMVDGSYVVQGTSDRWMFRLGKMHATALRRRSKR